MDPFDLRKWQGFTKAGGPSSTPAIVDQITIDSRRIDSKNSLFVALPGEIHDGHQFITQAAQAGASYALVSSNWVVPSNLQGITLLRTENPLKAFQEIARTYRLELPTKIIGISGSFGKTMVKDLLLQLLSTQKLATASPESFNSQIGVALSLLTLRKEHEIAIIEAAISQKNEMDILADLIRPDYTILTPVGNKHLATFDDMTCLTSETLKLVDSTKSSGWTLLPKDPQINMKNLELRSYYWTDPDDILPHAFAKDINESIPSSYQLKFPDKTAYEGQISSSLSYFLNLINMAAKAAWLSDISAENIRKVFDNYHPEPMRTEIWKTSTGAVFINDLYCSDPQSVDNAIKHFQYAGPNQQKMFLFGGMRNHGIHESNDYRRIGQIISKANLQQLFLYGKSNFYSLVTEVKSSSPSTEILVFEKEDEALSYLKTHLRPSGCVLIKGIKKFSLDLLTETFNDSLNNNQCFINLAAIKTNLTLMRKRLSPNTRFMVIVKALAYGTDDVQMAKFLDTCDVDILGVSYVDEGVTLKRAGVKQAIFSINAAIYEVTKVVKWDLEVGVSDKDFVNALADESKKQGKQVKVTLHVNTGMGRFGCSPEQALELAKLIITKPNLIFEGMMTHFSSADDPMEDAFTFQQVSIFDKTIKEIQDSGIEVRWTHASSSSGAIRFNLSQYNMVRIGIAAYGLYSSDAVKKELDLRLAVSLTSRIVGINILKKGESISYGRRYTVERDEQRIAVLPIGYFDGIHRHYSGKSHVQIRGKKAPMVGSICMDYMMVDITDIPQASVGDRVLIFGEDEFGQYLSPEEFASSGNSIIHELITCLGPRIQRIFVYEERRQIR